MTLIVYKGVHSTCLSQAESISRVGIRPSPAGRAGAGAYLWAYDTDPTEAEALARDWYQDSLVARDYDKYPKKSRVLLYFEIELGELEWLNVNSTWHHERIRVKAARAKDKANISKAYDDHIEGIAKSRWENRKILLKVVESSLPVPMATRSRTSGTPLTVGADAYIVLPAGIPFLKLVSAVGMPLKGANNGQ